MVERHAVVPAGAVGAGVRTVAWGKDGVVDAGADVCASGVVGDAFRETGSAAEKPIVSYPGMKLKP